MPAKAKVDVWKIGGKKNVRPGEFRRHREIRKIPIDEINMGPSRTNDDHFINLYISWLQGRLKGYLTRVDIAKILPGVVTHNRGRDVQRIEFDEDKQFVKLFERKIREGHRPHLVLYPGHLPSLKHTFICADDMCVFYAYRDLGISRIPALILGKPNVADTSESIISSSYNESGSIENLSLHPQKVAGAHTMIGPNLKGIRIDASLKRLRKKLDSTLLEIAKFHLINKDGDAVHFHETLYSVAYRLREGISAIQLLSENGLLFQARPIVRSLYELYLNFYLDWLAPELMGPLLQHIAQARRLPKREQRDEIFALLRGRFRGLVDLCENVAEKASFSPLGSFGHSMIYGELSSAAHQDFGITLEYRNALAGRPPSRPSRHQTLLLIRTLDLIVSATAMRILDDVGVGRSAVKPARGR